MTTGDAVFTAEELPDRTMLPAAADPALDGMARLAQRVLRTPLAAVTLVSQDEHVFAGAVGLGAELEASRTTTLSYSICRHVVTRAEPFIVVDTRAEAELATNRSVTELGIRAYAGVPLRDSEERAVGSLCVMDYAPRSWSDDDVAMLGDLAEACTAQLQLRQLIARTAVSRERDRIGDELQREVVAALFRHSMTLGSVRSQVGEVPARQLTDAIDDLDAVIVRLRNSIHAFG